MATSTMHATNGASMNCSTALSPWANQLAASSRGIGISLRQRRHDRADQIKERVHARSAADVRRNDHGLPPCSLGDLTNLVVVEVARRQQDPHVPLLHEIDQLADVF